MHNTRKAVIAALVTSVLGGCAAPGPKWVEEQRRDAGVAHARPQNGLLVSSAPYIDRKPVAYRDSGPKVNLALADVALRDALQPLVSASGWSLAWAGGASPKKKVTLDLRGQPRMEAICKVASAAGYVAVLDREGRQVTISPTATFTYQLPVGLFDSDEASYSVGASNSGGSGGGGSQFGGGGGMYAPAGPGGGGSQGGGSGLAGSNSSFSIRGSAAAENPERFLKTVATLAGEGAQVTANWQVGVVTVSANAGGLERVTRWITDVVRRAMTQVEVQVAILDIELNDETGFGIDWNKVVGQAAKGWSVSLATANLIGNPTATITRTTASIDALINVLATNRNVAIVSKPRILARNNKPAVVFNGTEIPYLGDISTVVSGEIGTNTQSDAQVSYALNGVSMGVVPSILGNDQVDLKLVPLLSRVGDFRTFTTSGGVLEAPERYTRQMYLNVVIPDGQTVILGGISSKRKAYEGQSLPGLMQMFDLAGAHTSSNSELVMLISSRILPPPKYDPLIGMGL